jgi:hypothetical protein
MRIVTTLTALFDTQCEAEGAETNLTQRGIAPENVTLLQDTAQGLSLAC